MDGASDSRLDVDSRTFSMIRLWPWLRLFRCAGVAMDARKLILCGLGLLVFTLGRYGLARLRGRVRGVPPPDPAGARRRHLAQLAGTE